MSKRKYEPGAFVPCSPKHKHCSPAHAAFVRGYREERQRQELEYEELTGLYRGEAAIWEDSGRRLVTFKQWLISHKGERDKCSDANADTPGSGKRSKTTSSSPRETTTSNKSQLSSSTPQVTSQRSLESTKPLRVTGLKDIKTRHPLIL